MFIHCTCTYFHYMKLAPLLCDSFIYLSCFSSDKPGYHNFDLLKKLVLPDGSVLRAQLPGRPTRDSLFVDPARDGTRFVYLNLHSL